MDRSKIIIRTSVLGIIANILLAAFKAVVGLSAHSIAIVVDAVNNITDALSSVVTIVGNKLAERKPDRNHPLGHGRIEYLAALIVAGIVLYAGITALVESAKKIIHPQTPGYGTVTLIIVAVAVVVKLILARYVKSQGKKANSVSLIASGQDAFFDAIISSSILISAIIYIISGFSLEAYLGVIIAGIIIKAGIDLIRETLNDILGHRADSELTKKIREILNREPDVRGAYDLFISDYGPERNYASVHLELPDTMTVAEVDKLTRRAQIAVYRETGVILTGIGVYSYNTTDNEAAAIRHTVQAIIDKYDFALELHGFFADTERKEIRFDIVLSFDIDKKEALRIIHDDVRKAYPGYIIKLVGDVDITD